MILRDSAEDLSALEAIHVTLESIRAGGSALRACIRLGYTTDSGQPVREDIAAFTGFGVEAPEIHGRYKCPSLRCLRQAEADQDGREPFCSIDSRPMTYVSGDK